MRPREAGCGAGKSAGNGMMLLSRWATAAMSAAAPRATATLIASAATATAPATAPVDPWSMPLTLMHDFAASSGAVCLDGSPGGFYLRPATQAGASQTGWVLHFQGDAWCFDPLDCLGRSKMGFGSSAPWANLTRGWNGGSLSPDNPRWGGYNKVILMNCDGASFTGDRVDPLVISDPRTGNPAKLYFRGRRILDAVIATLARDHGLRRAEDVLLTGCSSGGLAAYLHSDYVRDSIRALAPKLRRFKTAPVSGFFLLHNNVDGAAVYPDQMKNVYAMQNASGGLSKRCLAAQPPNEQWRCMFAQNAYAHTAVPTFVENSALDSWQTWCIFTAEYITGWPKPSTGANGNCSAAKGWRACSQDPENCSAAQMSILNSYMTDYVATLKATRAFSAKGNGAFIHSCHNHCEGLAAGWGQYTIGNTTMGEAAASWWDAQNEPAEAHTYLPCHYHTTKSPHKCNPTCFG